MKQIVDILLSNCRHTKLEPIKQELIKIYSAHRPLNLRVLDLKSHTSWLGRLNPFTGNELVAELRQLNTEIVSLEKRYDALVEEVRAEVRYAAQQTFPLQLAWLLRELDDGINSLKVERTWVSQDLGSPFQTHKLEGKENLARISKSISNLLIQHFGGSYKQSHSKDEMIDIVVHKILSSMQLPICINQNRNR